MSDVRVTPPLPVGALAEPLLEQHSKRMRVQLDPAASDAVLGGWNDTDRPSATSCSRRAITPRSRSTATHRSPNALTAAQPSRGDRLEQRAVLVAGHVVEQPGELAGLERLHWWALAGLEANQPGGEVEDALAAEFEGAWALDDVEASGRGVESG